MTARATTAERLRELIVQARGPTYGRLQAKRKLADIAISCTARIAAVLEAFSGDDDGARNYEFEETLAALDRAIAKELDK